MNRSTKTMLNTEHHKLSVTKKFSLRIKRGSVSTLSKPFSHHIFAKLMVICLVVHTFRGCTYHGQPPPLFLSVLPFFVFYFLVQKTLNPLLYHIRVVFLLHKILWLPIVCCRETWYFVFCRVLIFSIIAFLHCIVAPPK